MTTSMKKTGFAIGYFLIFFFCCIFLLTFSTGDDIAFHAQRIDAISKEFIESGIFAIPIRIYHSTLNGAGYSSPLFYGDIFLYPAGFAVAFLHMKVLTALKLTFACVLILSGLSFYYSVQCFGIKNNFVAVFSSILYMFSPYCLADIFNRAAIGEYFAVALVPMILGSFKKVISDSCRKRDIILLSISISALLLSHLITTAIIFVILLFWFVITLLIHLLKEHKIHIYLIKNVLLSAIISIAISAWFCFPLLEQLIHTPNLNAFSGSGRNPADYTIEPLQMFITWNFYAIIQTIMSKFFGIQLPALSFFTVGAFIYPLFMILGVFFLYRKRFDRYSKNIIAICIFVSLLFLFLMIFKGAWSLSALSFIQFPWRLLLFFTFSICLASGFLLNSTEIKSTIKFFIITSFLLSTSIYIAPMLISDPDSSLSSNLFTTYSIGLDDYLLNGYTGADLQARGNEIISDNAAGLYTIKNIDRCYYITYNNSVGETIEIPVTYVFGYSAHNELGQDIPIKSSDMGLIELQLPHNNSGTIIVEYTGTWIQHVADVFSLISICILLIFFFIYALQKIHIILISTL